MTLPPFPFRLGTTSYIVPDDILPNVRFLADMVQDIELVLFEVDDGSNNLPSAETVAEMQALAAAHGLSYTVHLPLDLRLGADEELRHPSLVKAERVIERTRALPPFAYVLHLDGREERDQTDPQVLARWQQNSVRALRQAAAWAGDPALLAVENLEGYPLDFWEPVFDQIPVSRCVDIGHLWLDGRDPLVYLQRALPRTRVIHLHGIGTRDHQSLRHADPAALDAVLAALLRADYRGVLTLEIFGEEDFHTSLQALQASRQRLAAGGDLWAKA